MSTTNVEHGLVYVATGRVTLEGNLLIPDGARGVVMFAHGSGSSRFSSRNRYVADPETNAKMARRVLEGELGPHRDIVLLNAAAGLVVAGYTRDLKEGVRRAADVIDGGDARRVLANLVSVSQEAAAAEA